MLPKLLILGAGQYGAVVKEIAEEINQFGKIDFLDDSYGSDNTNYHEESVGKISDLDKFTEAYQWVIPAIGNAELRMELIKKAEDLNFIIPTLVSKRAYVSKSAQLQKGVVIEPMATVHANALICRGSYISAGAVVNHNAVVSSGCHIDNNAVVMSGAVVEPNITTRPCEVVRRVSTMFERAKDGNYIGTPRYVRDEQWVKDYIKENGHEPTFF